MNLVLLTANFPYHPGEQFLEGEIGILAKNFEKILIVPLNPDIFTKDVHPRPFPKMLRSSFFSPKFVKKDKEKEMALQAVGLSQG
ncbi:MAG: hypothetical protein MZU79_05495 [Anaerotruncus sp.]|nr:hypothetical protein [Anaerotruncus sp.]